MPRSADPTNVARGIIVKPKVPTPRVLSSREPPRLVVRALMVTFATVAVVLTVVFGFLWLDLSDRVRRSATENLDTSQRLFSTFESWRQRESQSQVETLAESPALQQALQMPTALSPADADAGARLSSGVTKALEALAQRVGADVLAVVDSEQRVIASAGRLDATWPVGHPLLMHDRGADWTALNGIATFENRVFRVVGVPIVIGDGTSGTLYLATSLDKAYARELSELSRGGQTAIFLDTRLVATTLSQKGEEALALAGEKGLPREGVLSLEGESHAFRRVYSIGGAQFYAMGSIDAPARNAFRAALGTLAVIALGAIALAAVASVWLARMLVRPIDDLSRSLSSIAASQKFDERLTPTGSSRELDALTRTFNDLLGSVAAAEAQTQAATVGAIKALATALDARDPYTAGHSERVSALSVSIGRHMGLGADDLEVLRLGALLHDIGKIGVPDNVLRKAGALTSEEFELIKLHPGHGARILKSVPFLQPHIPIVELHHERPDGKGYPHGLRRDDIPQLARIAHVADAFDAITSARAYRSSRSANEAMAELWRNAGAEFDTAVVEALVAVLHLVPASEPWSEHGHTSDDGSRVVPFGRTLERAQA